GHGEDVHFTRWDGINFTSPLMLDPMDMSIFTASWAGPDLATFGDTMYVVFKENPEDIAPIYCLHSYDGGFTFSDPVIVDGMIGDNISRFPSVTVNDEGQPIVAFMKLDSDFGNAQYVVSTSDDFGNSFNMDVLASDFSGGEVCDCCPVGVTAKDNYVATLYRDNLDNLRNSWAGISTTGGDMFMNGIQIDQTDWIINACPSSGPDGVIINDSLYSVFMSAGEGDSRVYFSASSLSALTDEPDVRLTDEFTELSLQNYPRIANYGYTTAIVWKQNVNTESEIPILFTENITEGLPAIYDSVAYLDYYGLENADVAVSSTAVHVVWQDNYNDVVMYRKGTYADPVSINEQLESDVIKIYPNPAEDFVYVEYRSNEKVLPEVSDITGRKYVIDYTIFENEIKINTSSLPKGIYFLSVHDSDSNYTGKFLIK
ncbi:MAG: T9SS type A sorting domain-containing protein, partial [Fimbriimonadaceae bacterium]|nr:T9SS type A sorting domain-containing protein [Chitinophagales bacterium]